MKGWIALVTAGLLLAFIFSAASACDVAALEGSQRYALGIASERRMFEVTDEVSSTLKEEGEDPLSKGESRENEEEESVAEACAEEDRTLADETSFSVLLSGGFFLMEEGFDDPSLAERVDEKLRWGETESDYRAFAFDDRMQPSDSPLTDEEVAFVIARIVSTYTLAVPIHGVLENISFSREGDDFFARAVIGLRFDELREMYSLSWLPSYAEFTLTVPGEVKESKISVISDKISLKCDSFFLPEALLVFGCNMAFGKRDYKTLFKIAIENVFINAGIYR